MSSSQIIGHSAFNFSDLSRSRCSYLTNCLSSEGGSQGQISEGLKSQVSSKKSLLSVNVDVSEPWYLWFLLYLV